MQGTAKRWEQVTAYVRTRTMDDVIEMAKHGLAARAPKNDTFSILKKHQGNIVINSDATARNEVFTDVQVNLSGGCCCCSHLPPPPLCFYCYRCCLSRINE